MPRDPDSTEAEALVKARILLGFAAENKELPQTVVSTICASLDAVHAKSWDQSVATNFWMAFNSLCVLVRPVTMDTLSTNLQVIPQPRWTFWKRRGELVSPSRRTAGHYLLLLGVCWLLPLSAALS
jgi:hypothetical protein